MTNTDTETIATQDQPVNTRNDDQISVITLPSKLRDPVHDALVSHSVAASVDQILQLDKSNASRTNFSTQAWKENQTTDI
jgi:hypothetical protein